MLIPVVGFVVWIIVSIDVARHFGRGTGFGVGLALLPMIFYPVLGFGSDRYQAQPSRVRPPRRRSARRFAPLHRRGEATALRRPAIVALLLVVAAVAAYVALRSGDNGRTTGSVTMVGDSLNLGTEPYLADRYHGWKIDPDDVVGRTGEQGLEALRAMSRIGTVVVVSLGTNDSQTDAAGFRPPRPSPLADGRASPLRGLVDGLPGRPERGAQRRPPGEAGRYQNLEVADWRLSPGAGPSGSHPTTSTRVRRGTRSGPRRRRSSSSAAVRPTGARRDVASPAPPGCLLRDRLSWPPCAGRICSSWASLRCALPRRSSAQRPRPPPSRKARSGSPSSATRSRPRSGTCRWPGHARQRGLRARLDLRVCRRLVQEGCRLPRETPSTAPGVQGYGHSLGSVLVVKVGYNEGSAGYRDGIDRVMRAALAEGAHGVVWVTLRETSPIYRATNAEIRDAAAEWPQLVLADWNAWSAGKPWFGRDGSTSTRPEPRRWRRSCGRTCFAQPRVMPDAQRR